MKTTVNWRRLANRPIDFSKQGYPVFEVSSTPIASINSSAAFSSPSPGAMGFIAAVGSDLIYLSSPYTSGGTITGDIAADRVEDTKEMLFTLMDIGVAVFSPIVCGTALHPYADDKGHSWWMNWDLKMLRKCDRVAVLALAGWEKSLGVQMELELATILQKPIYLIRKAEDDPQTEKTV